MDDFLADFPSRSPRTKSEQDFRAAIKSVRILFQFTDDEVRDGAQKGLFPLTGDFDGGLHRSFVFVLAEVSDQTPTRTRLVAWTREINKRLRSPTVVLFRADDCRLALSFVHRRAHRRDPERDVLGEVSLIRNIDPTALHRAHLDILGELSLRSRLAWMETRRRRADFDSLLASWLDSLDTEELSRRFYRDLFRWFQRGVAEAKFPTCQAKNLPAEEHVIRLITRLLFVWFIKEKRLVAEELFVEEQVSELLANYDRDGDSYYRVVLQNLFFATLNTAIDKRGFSSGRRKTHRNFTRYRYRREMANPEALLALFRQTPFINGGLFDCLDSEVSTTNQGYRIDCFSDNPAHSSLLLIPNRLFFGPDGLVPLLEGYRFTVEENTPTDREVALDPELLGQVFENLLAAYNPETRETARKQTGSYYTPRVVVDHMVEQTLVASLVETVQPSDGDAEFWRERLEYLLDYADACDDSEALFTAEEVRELVARIARLRVLDPAVGSGAFPMGVLHRLTLALRRLDPENARWYEVQKEIAIERAGQAFEEHAQRERDTELRDISDAFEHYRQSDFGRKLYLIQNTLFGVDIQPVACQIARLRFFISLVIEQNVDSEKENFGVRPLPNLETRFVSANTTLPLGGRNNLKSRDVVALGHKLHLNREAHFHATVRDQKLHFRREDERLRRALAEALTTSGWAEDAADRVAYWNPYDQNASADWFEPKYMFGISDGFDIVVGNPPYVRADSGKGHQALRQRILKTRAYQTLSGKWDLYVAFMERSYRLLRPRGFVSLVVSDGFCHANYARRAQEFYLKESRVVRLDFLSKVRIFDAGVRNLVYMLQRCVDPANEPARVVHAEQFGTCQMLPSARQQDLTYRAFFPEEESTRQFTVMTVPLENLCYVSVGMVPNAHERKAAGAFKLADLVVDKRDRKHPKPFVEGKWIERWRTTKHRWLEWGTARAPAQFRRRTFPELYSTRKLVSAAMTASQEETKVALDEGGLHHNHSVVAFVPWDALRGVRNRSLAKRAKYADERKSGRVGAAAGREVLESVSSRYSARAVLGILNSRVAHEWLKSVRRNNLTFYPDDWKKLPIPDVSRKEQAALVALVDQILDAAERGAASEIGRLEARIEQEVRRLYGLRHEDA